MARTKRIITQSAIAGLAFTFAAPLPAQEFGSSDWFIGQSNTTSNSVSNTINNHVIGQAIVERYTSPESHVVQKPSHRAKPPLYAQNANADLTFQMSPQKRKQNYRSLFSMYASNPDPAARAELEKILLQGDLIGTASPTLTRKLGLRMNDLVDAYAFWLAVNWQASNADVSELTAARMAPMRKYAADVLQLDKTMPAASNAEKQQMADYWWSSALIINENMISAHKANDKASLDKIAKIVGSNSLREVGLDLTKVVMTEWGFVPREAQEQVMRWRTEKP